MIKMWLIIKIGNVGEKAFIFCLQKMETGSLSKVDSNCLLLISYCHKWNNLILPDFLMFKCQKIFQEVSEIKIFTWNILNFISKQQICFFLNNSYSQTNRPWDCSLAQETPNCQFSIHCLNSSRAYQRSDY